MELSQPTTIERPCPICASKQYLHFANETLDEKKLTSFSYASRKQPEFMCLHLVTCSQCSLVYAPSPPTSNFLLKSYCDADYDSNDEARCAAKSYAKALKPYIKKLKLRCGAVDVGAGNGLLLPWLLKFGFKSVLGIEPSAKAIDAAPASIKPMLKQGMFDSGMINKLDLSLICSFMTLEHIDNPKEFVTSAYQSLQQEGMIAIVVHNRQGFLNRVLGLKSPIIDIEHLQLYNRDSIYYLLKSSGFKEIKIQSISNSYPLKYWLRLMPLPDKLKKWIDQLLQKLSISTIKIPLRVGNILAVGYK